MYREMARRRDNTYLGNDFRDLDEARRLVLHLQQAILVEGEDGVEVGEKPPDKVWLRTNSMRIEEGIKFHLLEAQVHGVEHVLKHSLKKRYLGLGGLVLLPLLDQTEFIQNALEAFFLAVPKPPLQLGRDLRVTNEVLKRFIREPPTPVSAESGTCKQMDGH